MHRQRLAIIGAVVLAALGWQWHRVQAQGTISLTTCQNITSNGNYVLQNNVSSSGTCFSIRGNVTSLDFNGNGKTITVSSGDALEVADYGSGTPHHVTIHDFTSAHGVRTYGNDIHHVTFEDLTVDGITVYGSDDMTIQNNTVGSDGISVNNADQSWPPYRPTITDNTITGQVGHDTKILLEIVGGPVHPCPRIDAVITNNTILNYRNDPPPEATADVRIRCATHSIYTGNYARSDGTTIGLYLRDESDDGRYENNTFWTDSEEAIRMASGNVDKTFPARNLFRNNVFRSDSGAGTFFQGVGDDNVFDHNIFWSALRNTFNSGGHNTTYDHNTFYVKNSGQNIIGFDYDTSPTDTYTNNIFSYSGTNIFGYDGFAANRYAGNYNLFHNRGGSLSFGAFGATLAAWRTTMSDDAQSINSDPLFTNGAAGTFTLASGSPARHAGSDGSDLGAIPYGNTPPPPGATSEPVIICQESWSCGAWSACVNGSQSRTCTDANSCGTTTNRPALTQSCTCTESWTCGAWSTCTNSSQTRTCTDGNSCGTTTTRPAVSQSCTEPDSSIGDSTPPAAVTNLR